MLAASKEVPGYYEGVAEELEMLADAVHRNPQLSCHFAERLQELARQLRDDVRLMRVQQRALLC